MQDSGADICRAEGRQLAVGVQGVWVVVPGERACGQDDVGVADQQNAESRQDQVGEVSQPGQGETRQAGRDRADDVDSLLLVRREDRHHRRGENEDNEWSGQSPPQQGQGEQQEQAARGHYGRGPAQVAGSHGRREGSQCAVRASAWRLRDSNRLWSHRAGRRAAMR